MMEDLKELRHNLRTGDPDTYWLSGIIIFGTFALVGLTTGWF